MTLGTTELWSLRLTDARRHLEEGLALARRIERPYLEIGCLAHLGIAAPLSGLSASVALAFSEEAVTIAEAHGLATNPIVALAVRHRRRLAGVAGAVRRGGAVGRAGWAGCSVREEIREPSWRCTTRAACCTPDKAGSRTRWPSFRSAEKIQGILAGEHALTVDLRARIMLTQVRLGELSDARAALDSIAEQDRDRAEVRIPAAAIQLAEGCPGAGDRTARAGHRALRRLPDPDVGGDSRPALRRRRS